MPRRGRVATLLQDQYYPVTTVKSAYLPPPGQALEDPDLAVALADLSFVGAPAVQSLHHVNV